jgi:hypothetical protein
MQANAGAIRLQSESRSRDVEMGPGNRRGHSGDLRLAKIDLQHGRATDGELNDKQKPGRALGPFSLPV